MAPKYKLTYFDGYGAAESIRYIFAYANQEYEDVRMKQNDWPAIKPTTPFGKVPVLEIDGVTVGQSTALARYLAKKFGLTGKDDWESLQCDVLVDTLKDLTESITGVWITQDLEKKAQLTKVLLEKDLPFYLAKFNKIVAENVHGYVVGAQVTWADLTFTSNLDSLELYKPGTLKQYPALEGLVKKVQSLPRIKNYIEKRPADGFDFKL